MLTKDNGQSICLAVETSGRTGSIALGRGSSLIAEHSFTGMMRHSAELFASVKKLFHEAKIPITELKKVFITIGPGSFTGLRISLTLAKMMNLANETKIIPISTMNVIAANTLPLYNTEKPIKRLATVLDAKRKQFYIAVFEKNGSQLEKIHDDCLMNAKDFIEKFSDPDNPIILLGEGLLYYKDSFINEGIELLDEKYWYPKAAKLYEIGSKTDNFANAATLQPLYLRQPEAMENLKKSC